MMGFLYVLLCFAVGWVLTERFLPELRSPELNVHRRLGTRWFLGEERYPDAVRAGAALDVAVRPWLLVLVSSYLIGTIGVTWAAYLGAYLLRGTGDPLGAGNGVAFVLGAGILIAEGLRRRPSLPVPRNVGAWVRENRAELVFLGATVLVSWGLCSLTLFRRGDEICMGMTVFGDFTTHIAQARSFSLGRNFPTEYVFFADGTIRYHFLFQFLCGNLEYLGMPLVWAYNLQSVLAFTAMAVLLYQLAVATSGSRLVGFLTCFLGFFRSSFALFVFLWELPPGTSALKAILQVDRFIGRTPHEDWGLWNQNVFVNQRHLPFGVAVLLLVVLVMLPLFADLWDRLSREGREGVGDLLRGAWGEGVSWMPERWGRPLFLGVLLGASGFWNGAALLAALLILFVLAWGSDHRLEYLVLAGVALALAQAQKAFFFQGAAGIHPSIYLGFLTPEKTLKGLIFYYVELFGILPAVGLVALLCAPFRGRGCFALAAAAPLAFANAVSLTPDINVNHKYLFIAVLVGNVLVAFLLGEMMRFRKTWFAAWGLVAVLLSTGVVDLLALHNKNVPERAMAIQEKAPLKLWAQEHLDPNGVILSKNYYMHPVLAAGRKLFNGWQYYTWSAGYDTATRDRVVKEVLEGTVPERLEALLRENRIRYVLVDRDTRREYRVNDGLLRREASMPGGCLEQLYDDGDTVVYGVRER